MKNNRFLGIDIEYNKNEEILSLGLSTKETTEEMYFKNPVDKYSFNIHNLAYSFLHNRGKFFNKEKESIHKTILSYDYIIGFDMEKDLKILKFNKLSVLFEENNFIDLKILFNCMGFHTSLVKIGEIFDLNSILNKYLSAHNASYDSLLTYKILLTLVDIAEKNDKKEFIKDLVELTKTKYFGFAWDLDNFSYKFKWLENIIKSMIDSKKIDFKDNLIFNDKVVFYYENNYDFYLLNDNSDICFKFPKKYADLDKIMKLKKKHNLEIKYPLIGYRFSEDYVNNKTILTRGC